MSNSLDQDQDRRSVCPDLEPNCLQWLSADKKGRQYIKNKKLINWHMLSFVLVCNERRYTVLADFLAKTTWGFFISAKC